MVSVWSLGYCALARVKGFSDVIIEYLSVGKWYLCGHY